MSFQVEKKQNNLLSKPLACVASKLATKQVKNVITLAGAGISTSAGIADFRSPETGLYNKLRKYKLQFADVMWDKDYFLAHPETLYSILKDNFLQNPLKPTLTHCFIKLLETKGILLRHFTQNIDGMELMTGLSRDKLVEAHGTLHRAYCTSCGQRYDFQWLAKKMETNPVPLCESCGRLVRPDIVLFGENLCKDFELRSFIDFPQCDLLIILGTTLQVEPFASIMHNIPTNCPRLIISKYNLSEFKNSKYQRVLKYDKDIDDTLGYDAFLLGDCDASVHDLVGMIGWEDDLQKVVRDVKIRKIYGDISIVDVGVQTLPITADSDFDYLDEDLPKLRLKCANYRVGPKYPPVNLLSARHSQVPKKHRSDDTEKQPTKKTGSVSQPVVTKKLPKVDQQLLRYCNRCVIHTVCDK
ncbi:hypothetical protein GE061_010162 [Apolygus lucorum]|uniref:Deacetylase sirtuin-type domain-containing protein n=1 Tax=Apolygus lucorum TaxID=248454 RepID=A0A6A4JVV1_APOLU|nr:hypothetical protein GE061_010162 [Apolygus lucorum]